MCFLTIFLTVVTSTFIFLIFRRKAIKLNLPPGPRTLPVLGNVLDFTENNIFSKLLQYADQYGDICRIKVLNRDAVCLNSRKTVRKALCGKSLRRYTNDRGKLFFSEFLYYGSQSLAFQREANSKIHREMRKGYIKALYYFYQEENTDFDKRIQSELEDLNKKIEAFHGSEFDVLAVTRRSLTNVISVLLGGEPVSDDDEDISMFLDFIDETFFLINPTVNTLLDKCPMLRFAPGFRAHITKVCKAKEKLLDRYFIKEKKSSTDGSKRLVDILLEEQMSSLQDGKEVIFTDERIKSCILETVIAGITTTWSAISSTILCLINHPQYQDQIFAELDKTIGQDREPNYKDKVDCPMLEAVEMEVHRLFPVIPMSVGHICTKDIKMKNYDIPEGTGVMVNIWRIHHDVKIWKDPWNFRPERFLDKDGNLIAKDSKLRKNWIPFSMGKRQCVGKKFARSRYFLYMASLLRKWKFVGVPGKFGPLDAEQLSNYDTKVIMRPKPFFCTAEKRY